MQDQNNAMEPMETPIVESEEVTEVVDGEEVDFVPTRKYVASAVSKKEAAKSDKTYNVSSVETLLNVFDNEQFVVFQHATEDETITFRIKVADPNVLLLETSSPEFLSFVQNISADDDYISSLSPEELMKLRRSELDHKYRVLVRCVLEPELGIQGEPGFPVEELPAEIADELYSHCMGSATDPEEATQEAIEE